MQLKYEPDPLERRIEAKLRGIDGADGDTTPTVQWTMNVKKEIAGLCDDDCTAYFSGNPGGEWLYDLTILKQHAGGALARCVLALESEWGSAAQVSDDFQKLILCRADYRVMIFEARRPKDPKEQVAELIKEVNQHQRNQVDDRYFFAPWVRGAGFSFYTHIV